MKTTQPKKKMSMKQTLIAKLPQSAFQRMSKRSVIMHKRPYNRTQGKKVTED